MFIFSDEKASQGRLFEGQIVNSLRFLGCNQKFLFESYKIIP
jgi:hypothetical protein